jgi:hypothetical protein
VDFFDRTGRLQCLDDFLTGGGCHELILRNPLRISGSLAKLAHAGHRSHRKLFRCKMSTLLFMPASRQKVAQRNGQVYNNV